MSNTNTQSNNYIGCNTRGYIQGIDEGAGFEEHSIYTEPMHNGLVDIPSNEWHVRRLKLKKREYIVFSNDKVGMSLEDLKNMQIMANYKGARAGITGLYGVGLVALRSKICGETGRVYHISLPVDVENEYSTVDDFMTDMQDGLTNKDKLQAINYNMTDVMNGDTRIRHPEDLPSTAKKIWKACSINPLKKGTVLAYQCTENHSRFLDEQETKNSMCHSNMLYNLLFSAQDILSDEPERVKKMKYNDKNLKRIPSLEDYLAYVGGVQTWEQKIEVTHKKGSNERRMSSKVVSVTRKQNISIHNVTEVSLEYMIKLGVTDIQNVLPFIIEKEGGKPYMLREKGNASTEYGTKLQKYNLDIDKRNLIKIIKEMIANGAYTEEHKAVAVMDYEGYIEFIQPVLNHNGLIAPETEGEARRIIYGNKKKRSGVYLHQEWDELIGNWGAHMGPGFKRVQNTISWEGSSRGDKLNQTKMSKFNLGGEDKKLKRVHDFIEHKENVKIFGGTVEKLIKTEKNTLKFTMDIENRYNIKKGQNFHIMKDGEVKQVRLLIIAACSGKTADIIVKSGDDIIDLKYDTRGLHYNTLGQAIKAYEDRPTAPPAPPTIQLQQVDGEDGEYIPEQDSDYSSSEEEQEEEEEDEEEEDEEEEDEEEEEEQAVVEEEQADIHSPNTSHHRANADVREPLSRYIICEKLDEISNKNNRNEIEEEVVAGMVVSLEPIYNTIVRYLYKGSPAFATFLINAIARRTSSLQNRIDDIKDIYMEQYQHNEKVKGGVEINQIFEEITQ